MYAHFFNPYPIINGAIMLINTSILPAPFIPFHRQFLLMMHILFFFISPQSIDGFNQKKNISSVDKHSYQ